MKKILLLLALLLPMAVMSQDTKADKHASKYLRGAVPTENNIVTFTKSFRVPSKTDAQLYQSMLFFVKDNLVVKGIEDAWTRMISDGTEDGVIAARIEEWMTFSKKFLSLDRTRFRYQIAVTTGQEKVNITITQISYLYGEEWHENKPTGEGGTVYRAEEWITDEHALNKKGTKVLSGSGKFRRNTIERVEEIFNNAMDMFEEEGQKQEAAEKKAEIQKRRFVIE